MKRVVAFGPGRVNLIGEHTDYNAGLALPFAIELGVTVTARPADHFIVDALDLDERDEFERPEPAPGWRAFARGMIAELHIDRPRHLEITGTLPRGSGLSSSAALEAALALALLEEEPADRKALAAVCSRVENDWVGAETGLLDQYASLLARPGHALKIDFQSLEVEPQPLHLDGWQLATQDSGATHDLATSGYNERRAECRRACERLDIATLREATTLDGLENTLNRRARHVLTENERVEQTVQALQARDLQRVADLIDASHASLRDDYEASVPEVEETVTRLKAAGAAGARMVGGGFGGAVLALFPPGVGLPDGALPVSPAGPARFLPG